MSGAVVPEAQSEAHQKMSTVFQPDILGEVEPRITVTIRRDEWIPSRKWHADLSADDGSENGIFLRGWIEFCKTKKMALDLIDVGAPQARVIDHDGRVLREGAQ